MKRDDPVLYEELRQIARRYKEGKRIQADEGDAQGIPCPHPEVVGVQVQKLHHVLPGTNRFFICRQQACTPEGSFFGLNTDWISTEAAGGWKFVCPACGTPYTPNLTSKPGLIPANHIWHMEATNEFMLAEWPETLEEKSICEAAVANAEHVAKVHFTELSPDELRVKIGQVVANHGVKFEGFTTRHISDTVINAVTSLNTNRGAKKHPYAWDHLKDGYTGGFYRYTKGETPVMKSDELKDYLAMVYCLMLEDP